MMHRNLIFISLVAIAIGLVILWFAAAIPDGSDVDNAGLLQDDAGLLSPGQSLHLQRYHALLLQDHDIDYRVLTTRGARELNTYSLRRFEELGVGERSRTGRGFLLTIDAAQDRVRLEVSRSLEGTFTDAFVTYIQHRQMVPFFRSGRVADGILATTELIVAEAQKAVADRSLDPRRQQAGSSGGGASATAGLGRGRENRPSGENREIDAGRNPEATVRAYLQAMQNRNARPDLDLYTEASRKMLAGWTVTPAQMDMTASTYRRCSPQPARLDGRGRLAVIRYPPAQRPCAPWFLEKTDGRWRLDLTMMQKAVRFGRSNAWRFDLSVDHPYRFAFQDWTFDENGFPQD